MATKRTPFVPTKEDLQAMQSPLAHFWTTLGSEIDAKEAQGYRFDLIACYVPAFEALPGVRPFRRLFNRRTKDYIYTTADPDDKSGDYWQAVNNWGYVSDGITCFVYEQPEPKEGKAPLWRLFRGANTYNHFYTAFEAEKDFYIQQLGYVEEHQYGVALESNRDFPTIPLFRLYDDKLRWP